MFEMSLKFSVRKCQKALSELIIWPRYDQKGEDRLKIKSTFWWGDHWLITQSKSQGNNVNCYFM